MQFPAYYNNYKSNVIEEIAFISHRILFKKFHKKIFFRQFRSHENASPCIVNEEKTPCIVMRNPNLYTTLLHTLYLNKNIHFYGTYN